MKKGLAVLTLTVLLSNCGIYDYPFIPQVDYLEITPNVNSSAAFNLSNPDVYYAGYYDIFYKIYISDYEPSGIIHVEDYASVNERLKTDYDFFYPYTVPSNQLAITSSKIFEDRGYYSLNLSEDAIQNILKIPIPPAGTPTPWERIIFNIDFFYIPDPNLFKNANSYVLLRNSVINHEPDNSFFYSVELNNFPEKNLDVSTNTGNTCAYVSMYIIAVGMHPDNFNPIYSKPTHINIFRLPDRL